MPNAASNKRSSTAVSVSSRDSAVKSSSSSSSSNKKSAPVASAAELAAESSNNSEAIVSKKKDVDISLLPDKVIGESILFRLLHWPTKHLYQRLHGGTTVNFKTQPKDEGCLFYTIHSTHNSDILPSLTICYEDTGRVSRALMHRLIIAGFPLIRYIGAVAGERASAVRMLKQKFWCGVIPGGADEGLVGHENCYKLHWPAKRVGFAKVAMEAQANLVPFFFRNNEESRWNPFLELFSLLRVYVLFEWLVGARIPILSSLIYTLGHTLWFLSTFCQIPIPVRCTMIFGDPVPYTANDTTDEVVKKAHDALQKLIAENQPNWEEGRNYTRALAERWPEWKAHSPKLIRTVEDITPKFVKNYLKRLANPKLAKKRA